MDYRIIQRKNNILPQPNFMTFSKHVLLLSHKRVSEVEAEALKAYL